MYSGTVQESQIRLMGKKLLVALMMEGKFSGEGLDGFEEDDDMMSSMVRELLEEGGVGESADAIWQNLERERALHVPEPTTHEVNTALEQVAEDSGLSFEGEGGFSFDASPDDAEEAETTSTPFLVESTPAINPDPVPTSQTNVLAFALRPKPVTTRRKQPEYEDQMQLFG